MGVGQVLIGPSSGPVDVTLLVDNGSFEAKFQANQINSTSKATLLDESRNKGGTPVDIREQDDYIVNDDGVRIFGGRVARCQPQVDGKSVIWEIEAIGFDCLLDERIIPLANVRTGTRTLQAEVRWIAAFHSEIESATFVGGASVNVTATIDYSRSKSLREALQRLQAVMPGWTFWVDQNKSLHWVQPDASQLVVNPSFDGGVSTGWSLGTTTTVTPDVGPGGTGDHCLQSSVNTGTTTVQTITAITASRRYVFFLDMYSSAAAQAKATLTWQNASLATQRVDTVANAGTGWNRYKQVLQAPAGADRVKVELGGVASFSGTIRFDNVQMIGETAAYGVGTTPSANPLVYAPMGWSEDRQAIFPVNRLYVVGAVNGWKENLASIAYFRGRKFEAILEDPDVATQADIDARAAEVWRKMAFPSRTGTYWTKVGGLVPGSWQIIEQGTLGITTIDWLSTITTKFDGAGVMLYQVAYGNPEDSMGSALASLGQIVAYTGPQAGYANPKMTTKDTTAPAKPTGLTVSSDVVVVNNTAVVRMVIGLTQPADADLYCSYVEFTRKTLANDETAPDWGYSSTAMVGKADTQVAIEGVAGFSPYFIRAWSEDQSGNHSYDIGDSGYAYMPAPNYPFRTAKDATAPAIPVIDGAVPMFRGIAASWSGSAAADLRFYQVRWSRDGWATYDTVDVMATVYAIMGLDAPDIPYQVEVRAVDVSGNVMGSLDVTGVASTDVLTASEAMFADGDAVVLTSLTGGAGLAVDTPYWVRDTSGATFKLAASPGGAAVNFTTDVTQAQLAYASATPVDYSTYLTAGWSLPATATPTTIGQADLGANSVRANHIYAGEVTSAAMTGQTITAKVSGAYAKGFRVLTSADLEAGLWDDSGLTIRDTADADKNAKRYLRLRSGSLLLVTDGVDAHAVAAITPDGIDASRITFGAAPGGHNLIRNSSFELSADTGGVSALTHTDTTYWNATYHTSIDNVTEGTTLAVTSW